MQEDLFDGARREDLKKHSIAAEIVHIGPAVAARLLASKARNRHISSARVGKLVQELRTRWAIAQPIMLDEHGRLIDGQHRLTAVVQAKVTVPFLVVRGLAGERTFGVLDITQERKLKDWLEIHCEQHPQELASVLTMAWHYENKRLPHTAFPHLPVDDAIEFLKKYPELRTSVSAPGVRNTYLPRSFSAWLHFEFSKRDRTLANDFLVELIMGTNAGKGDPIEMLRAMLKADKAARKKMTRSMKLALAIKAWNAVRADKRVDRLTWDSPTEKFPAIV